MSRRCQTTSRRSGLVLGGFLAHFEPIRIEGRTIWDEFWAFFRENKLPLGENTLGLVLGEIYRVCSWKRKNT